MSSERMMTLRHMASTWVLVFLASCGGKSEPGGTVMDASIRPDGGVLTGDPDAMVRPQPDSGPPSDSGMPPPPDGGDGGPPPPPGDGGTMMMMPTPCTTQAECTNACPPDAIGCTCAPTPMGMICIPACMRDEDCPHPPDGVVLVCDMTHNVCIPRR